MKHLDLTPLPANAPARIIVVPTRNRWKAPNGKPGSITALLRSLDVALVREKHDSGTWVLIADASNAIQREARDSFFRRFHAKGYKIFILSPHHLKKIARIIQKKYTIAHEVIDSVLIEPGYGSQRQKLDAITTALVNLSGSKCQLSLDDDVTIPPHYLSVRTRFLKLNGYHIRPNSQLIMPHSVINELKAHGGLERRAKNAVAPLFDLAGKTIGEIRSTFPHLRVTAKLQDTMQEGLERALQKNKPVQAVYTSSPGKTLVDAEKFRALGVLGLTSMNSDFHAFRIATIQLQEEFPTRELVATTIPTGGFEAFAHVEGKGNICSSGLIRYMDSQTSFYPWWFVSSENISRKNPLRTVVGPYRADNDLLPKLLSAIQKLTGEKNVYLAGIPCVMHHGRAQYGGARTDIIEQGIQSLVGKIPAYEVLRRLYWDKKENRMRVRLIPSISKYRAPRTHVRRVFKTLEGYVRLCDHKIIELKGKKEKKGKRARYQREKALLMKKTGRLNFRRFEACISRETALQVNFYADILDAMPSVVDELTAIVKKGTFMVYEAK